MRNTLQGKVLEVGLFPIKAEMLEDAPIGATELLVDNIYEFLEEGGLIRVDDYLGDPPPDPLPEPRVLTYTGFDEDAGTLILSAPLVDAIPEDTVIFQEPYAEEKLALVQIDEGDDPVTCRIQHHMQSTFEDGVRQPYLRETVLVAADDDDELYIVEQIVQGLAYSASDISYGGGTLQEELESLDADLLNLNGTVLPQLQLDLDAANADITELNTVTLPALQVDLDAANADITTLNTVTIPNLNSDLSTAQTAIDTLNNTTIPGINSDVSAVESDINTLNTVTIPGLDSDITAVEGDINTLNTVTIPGLNSDLSAAQGDIDTLNNTTIPGLNSDITAINNELDSIEPFNSADWFPVIGTNISDGAISTPKITVNTLNGDRVTANTLNAAKILAGSIGTDRMTANTINGDRVTANTLNASKIVAGSITSNEITVNTLNGDRLTAGTLDATKIVAGSIGTDRMTANSINGDRITADTLNASKIVAGTITTDRMTFNTISGDRIATNTLDAGRIVAGTIYTALMTANAINGDRITANTLNASKIVAGTITTDRMTANTINGDRVITNTLNASKIVAGSITTDKMTANTINGDRIISNTIHADKIIANTLQAAIVNAGAVNGITITGSVLNGGELHVSSSTNNVQVDIDANGLTVKNYAGGTLMTTSSGTINMYGSVFFNSGRIHFSADGIDLNGGWIYDMPRIENTAGDVIFNVANGIGRLSSGSNVKFRVRTNAGTGTSTAITFTDDWVGATHDTMNAATPNASNVKDFYCNVLYRTSQSTLSDVRDKNPMDIVEGFDPLALLSAVEIRKFSMKNDEENTPHYGVFAHELWETLPDLVRDGKFHNRLSVDYDSLYAINIMATQELIEENKALRETVNDLNEKMAVVYAQLGLN